MEYTKLGRSGLEVSRLSLGTMGFGVPERGNTPWSLNEEQSRPIIKKAIESGINFFSSANMYSDGTSEEILGRALKDFGRRDEFVISTKVFVPMRKGPNAAGLARKAIMTEIDNSLRRLGTDYVDVYQIHRWDPHTPIEETMEALHDLVKTGKVRYIGASSMLAWQFAKAQHAAERKGWTRFVSMENRLNLLYREEEREMLPLCKDEGVGITPYLPLAAGRLTRDWNEQTSRSEKDQVAKGLFVKSEEADRKVVERLSEVAANRGLPRAQIALAWLLQKDGVTAPIIGATKLGHIEDAVAALSVRLTPDEIMRLEELYIPHAWV
ncbi:Predicted oxidoreductase [Paenibacillus sp. UNC496MF]|uniref:aldo/keto reductase n=1 Tax=Paenibacillus sp. UNC496MF TaxID=1502753 RepID=UPI0008E0C705|nr:aldo/keto reductase [Paenibacillus sp. UNC496MF]SFJ83198.1 Predicted oxidoreductase [Paenibacillus sp. UNC496MF]